MIERKKKIKKQTSKKRFILNVDIEYKQDHHMEVNKSMNGMNENSFIDTHIRVN